LRAASVGGDAAGRLGDDSFGIVAKASHSGERDTTLASEIAEAISEAGISDGQVASRVASIDLSFGNLTNSEASRALSYALSTFVKAQGADFDVASLQSGLMKAMDQAVVRFADTRKLLADGRSSSSINRSWTSRPARCITMMRIAFPRWRRYLRDGDVQRGSWPHHRP
jgi:GGDEF domain-containing protein